MRAFSSGPGLPVAAEMYGKQSGIHYDTATGKLNYWNGSNWTWMRLVPAVDGAAGTFLDHSGAFSTPASSGAPTGAQYLVGATDGTLTAERVVTDTAEVTWDLGTAGQAKANVGAIAESKVTGLVSDLAGKASASHSHAESDVTGLVSDLSALASAIAATVPTTRAVNTTAPLTGGGALSADLTIALPSASLTNATLANMAAGTVKGTVIGGGGGVPLDLTQAQQRSNIGATATPTGDSIPMSASGGSGRIGPAWLEKAATTGILRTNASGVVEWLEAASANCWLIQKGTSTNPIFPVFSGTTAPVSPVSGQIFTHDTLDDFQVYSIKLSQWRSRGDVVRKVYAGGSSVVASDSSRVVAKDYEIEATATLEVQAGGVLEIIS